MADDIYAVKQDGTGVAQGAGSAHTTLASAIAQLVADIGVTITNPFTNVVRIQFQDSLTYSESVSLTGIPAAATSVLKPLVFETLVGLSPAEVSFNTGTQIFVGQSQIIVLRSVDFNGQGAVRFGPNTFGIGTIIEDCDIHDVDDLGVHDFNGVVRRCRIHDVPDTTSGFAGVLMRQPNEQVIDSFLYDNGRAIEVQGGTGKNIVFNAFSGNVEACVKMTTGVDPELKNNIYDVPAAGFAYERPGADPNVALFFSDSDFNCYNIAGGGLLASGSVTYADLPAWTAGAPDARDASSIEADPLFVSAGAKNFRIQNASPCVEAGTPIPAVTTIDIDLNPRDAVNPDIGAFEVAIGTLPEKGHRQFPSDGQSVLTVEPRLVLLVGPDLREQGTVQARWVLSKSNLFDSEPDLTVSVAEFESWLSGEKFGGAIVNRVTETYDFIGGGQTLDVKVDGAGAVTVTFLVGDFSAPAAGTAQEVATKISTVLSGSATSTESANEPGRVRIVSDAGQLTGSIEITGGTANAILGFDTFIHDYNANDFEQATDYVPYADPTTSGTWGDIGTGTPSATGVSGTDGADASSKELREDGVTDGTTKVTSATARFSFRGVINGDKVTVFDPVSQTNLGQFTVATVVSDTELTLSGNVAAGSGLIVVVEPVWMRWKSAILDTNTQYFWRVKEWTGEVL